MSALAQSFRDLRTYQEVREAALVVFAATHSFPPDERYALTDQVRRSSRAVCALLAEAWGRRRYPAAFAHKLTEALGEAHETQAWLDHALDCRYITQEQHAEMNAHWQTVGGRIVQMIRQRARFCHHPQSD